MLDIAGSCCVISFSFCGSKSIAVKHDSASVLSFCFAPISSFSSAIRVWYGISIVEP